MHTVEILEQAVHVAHALGYVVRQEHLGGAGGGACELAGRKYVFVDLTLPAAEQLDQLVQALQEDPRTGGPCIPEPVQRLFAARRAA